MANRPAPGPPDLGERIAREATRSVSAQWLAQCYKIEEHVPDAAARWALLKRALTIVSRRGS